MLAISSSTKANKNNPPRTSWKKCQRACMFDHSARLLLATTYDLPFLSTPQDCVTLGIELLQFFLSLVPFCQLLFR